MSQSSVSETPVYEGYDRSIWESSEKPYPTLSDTLDFEDERLINDTEEDSRQALLKAFKIISELEFS